MDLQDSIGLAFFTIILTLLTNIGFKYLQNTFDFMVETKKFKRDYYYKQLTELYIELYAVIAQSEFLRYFYDLNNFGTFKDLPFIETNTEKEKVEKDLFTGKVLSVEKSIVKTAISDFNKMKLVDLVLSKKHLASQDLLKLIVAYRYCHNYYLKHDLIGIQLEKFQTHEFELIHDIVIRIVRETNERLKFCDMAYNEYEREHGVMDSKLFDLKKLYNESEEK
ncbi:hypothetical protein V7112_08610 [Bacillus sp. JJ1566]|uniref:hypothetical protein n=1 Tax=Bacillus sp. JJ1566 TaxID=3122961 RepID=UPI002FFFB5F4